MGGHWHTGAVWDVWEGASPTRVLYFLRGNLFVAFSAFLHADKFEFNFRNLCSTFRRVCFERFFSLATSRVKQRGSRSVVSIRSVWSWGIVLLRRIWSFTVAARLATE